MKTGRNREVDTIVAHDRAVEVANLMLGKLDGPMKCISADDYIKKPRRELKAGNADVRRQQAKIETFCRENFRCATVGKLADFYERVHRQGSQYSLPMQEFVKAVGEPCDGRLKGAPLHSTIRISPWGLQTEYPEMHLCRDLAISFNKTVELKAELDNIEGRGLRWSDAKKKKPKIAGAQSKMKYSMRMSLICCFNLLEAYINGVAWRFRQVQDIQGLSEKRRKTIEGDQTSILDKLVKVPRIVSGREDSPLAVDRPPLSVFRDMIKPFRDSIVHASPFSAPERYGGYDKLSKIYDLEFGTVSEAVHVTIEIIGVIHRFLGDDGECPKWLPHWRADGQLILDE